MKRQCAHASPIVKPCRARYEREESFYNHSQQNSDGAALFNSQKNLHIQNAIAQAAAIDKSQAVIEFKLDGTILSWNAGAQRLFGYTAGEAVGRSITLIIPPDRLDEERGQGRRPERVEPVALRRDLAEEEVLETADEPGAFFDPVDRDHHRLLELLLSLRFRLAHGPPLS